MSQITKKVVQDVAEEVVRKIAGPDAAPRSDQIEAVTKLLVDGRRTLLVQPTGWGKSAAYWIASTVVRRNGGGVILVISPLLALMRNQVLSAKKAGLRAATLNSSNSVDWDRIERSVLNDELDILLVSPERLANPRFLERVMSSLNNNIGLIVIDEAHCISSWGHDFRPTYQLLAKVITSNPNTPVLCTTATASSRVTADVAAQLGNDTYVLRGQLARESLHLGVVEGLGQIEQFAWVLDSLNTLEGSGIVYCLTTDKVDRLTEFLASQGIPVASYHGQMDTDTRLEVESKLMRNELKAVVATSALGMGYDKPDLAFCIHVGSPSSPIDYYQQIGRAGRALDKAPVILLSDPKTDIRIWEWMATSSIPTQSEMEAVLDIVRRFGVGATLTDVANEARLTRDRSNLLLHILGVDGAITRTEEGWDATSNFWNWDGDKYDNLLEVRRQDSKLMFDYASSTTCLETLLRIALDDAVEAGTRCGRCSVCTGRLPDPLVQNVKQESVVLAQEFLRSLNYRITTRKRWPKDFLLSGVEITNTVIKPQYMMEEGRSIAHGDDPAWSGDVDNLRADGIFSEELENKLRDVLTQWETRATVVVPMPSSRQLRTIDLLSDLVSKVFDAPLVDALRVSDPSTSRKGQSMQARAFEMAKRISVVPDAAIRGQVVVLVDDSAHSKWTLTIAAALLRAYGAASVAPLVLQTLASNEDE